MAGSQLARTSLDRRIGCRIARVLARMTVGTAARVRFDLARPLPRKGAFILACNHISHFDPPILGAWLRRPVDWMAMEELFRDPWADRFLRLMGAFPVNRGEADRAALRVALGRLAEGRVVGIFPEGGIRAGASSVLERAPMRPGVALLSALGRVPVVPAVILGSDRLYQPKNWLPVRRVPVWIAVGEPIAPPAPEAKESGRKEVREALAAAFVALKDRLVAKFGLRPGDIPTTPQARKGEDPIPLSRKRP